MYSHPEVGEQLIFQTNQVEVKTAPTLRMEFNKLLGQAGKDPEAVLQVAAWGLKKGLVPDFYAAIDKVLSLDPQHARAQRIKELKRRIDANLPDDEDRAVERTLKGIVNQSGMRIESSHHFMLLCDTDSKAGAGHRLNRAKERLKLLEQMYERFVLLFEVHGVELELPRERLMTVLFKDLVAFQEFTRKSGQESADSAGCWSPIENVVGFYNDSLTEDADDLKAERDTLEKQADEARKTGVSLERRRDSESLRQVKINDVLLEIDRWNSDVATVSREAARQLAANTGLLPRRVEIPAWVQEGLASYFAAPSDGAWAGSGAVSESRLEDYGALKQNSPPTSIDFIVADQILGYASAHGAKRQGDAQAWALTHFLFERHAKELVTFYGLIATMPPDVALNGELLRELFNRAFGSDHVALSQEWHSFMRTLKTDVARMEDLGDKKSR
jgi:hypothetical protein